MSEKIQTKNQNWKRRKIKFQKLILQVQNWKCVSVIPENNFQTFTLTLSLQLPWDYDSTETENYY